MTDKHPCCDWRAVLDSDEASPETRTQIEQCETCRANLRAEAAWETSVRDYADSLSQDFHWSAPSVIASSSKPQRHVPSRHRTSIRLLAVAASFALVCWTLVQMDSEKRSRVVRSNNRPSLESNEEANASLAFLEPEESNRERARLSEKPNAVIRSISSMSHLAVSSPNSDDDLTFVMFFPRVKELGRESISE
ncbi:MAG: hypothetical protein AAF802_24570 [Planctomycetota bacterium]